MTKHSVSRLTLISLPFLFLVELPACSPAGTAPEQGRPSTHRQALAAGNSSEPGAQPTGTTYEATQVDPVDEAAQIQAYLDQRYEQKDVKHSFETQFGEMIDCVDFFGQSSAKELAKRGMPITEIPQPPQLPPVSSAVYATQKPGVAPDDHFDGRPDRLGRPRACPKGSVPKVRITADDILAAGGLDAFRNRGKAFRDGRGMLPEAGEALPSHAHIQQEFTGSGITETESVISVHWPKLPSMASALSR